MTSRLSCSLHGLLAFVLLAVPAVAQNLEETEPEIPKPTAEDLQASRAAASEALRVVALLADPLLEKLGLGHADARAGATLGEPIPVFNIHLNQLKEHLAKGEDPRRLLTRSDEMFYPISIGDEVVSSVTVRKNGDDWVMISIGQSHLTAKLIKMHRLLELTDEHVVAVNVPAMYQMFLVHASAKLPLFIPVYDVPFLELVAMQTIGHGEWFDKIKSMVEKFESALHHEEEERECAEAAPSQSLTP